MQSRAAGTKELFLSIRLGTIDDRNMINFLIMQPLALLQKCNCSAGSAGATLVFWDDVRDLLSLQLFLAGMRGPGYSKYQAGHHSLRSNRALTSQQVRHAAHWRRLSHATVISQLDSQPRLSPHSQEEFHDQLLHPTSLLASFQECDDLPRRYYYFYYQANLHLHSFFCHFSTCCTCLIHSHILTEALYSTYHQVLTCNPRLQHHGLRQWVRQFQCFWFSNHQTPTFR